MPRSPTPSVSVASTPRCARSSQSTARSGSRVERLFFQRNVQTAMAVGQARGVALLAAAEAQVPIDEPTPNEVKQQVCGNGAADKRQVAAMVERLLGISLERVPDDATDALALAIGCAYRAAAEPKVIPMVKPG